MTINRLSVTNFLMFTGEKEANIDLESLPNMPGGTSVRIPRGSFDEEFVSGINVFIGVNATGKSTLLKCIYAACESSNQKTHPNKAKKFPDYFSASQNSIKEMNQKQSDDDFGLIQIYSGETEFHYRTGDNGILGLDQWLTLGIQSILIPTAEILSHSKGLLAMSSKYDRIPFDDTQIDILVNAQLWETKEISERNKKILNMIGNVIDGEVIFEDDTFYVVKSNGLKVEFSLEADGFRKLGLLWRLIRNGLLESGSILLWDEPDASINPELIPLLADILYILKNDGVQIFIATHNYTLAKYIDIKKQNADDALFISLYKNDAGEIKTSSSNSYSTLQNNSIETSEEKLYNAIIEKSLEDNHGQ